MSRLDLSTATLEDVDALLDQPDLPDGTAIAGLEKLATEGYLNYLSDFVRRGGLSEAVLVKGAELLAIAEDPRPSAIAHVLDNANLGGDAQESVRASLVQAIANMDEMVMFSSLIEIHKLLNFISGDDVKLAVIEGLGKQDSGLAKSELRDFINRSNNPRLKEAAEQALKGKSGITNPLAGDGMKSPRPKSLAAQVRTKFGLGPKLKR